jgi:S-adenosylmethionine:tRNA ribosyltransferase-isomerase
MNLSLSDYTYTLPADRIAQYPLKNRDEANLLFYKSGQIEHKKFTALPDLLPQNSLLVFNNTKVISARLHFQKESGAMIELFLLNPVQPSSLLIDAMQAHSKCVWKCTIGNLKRWTGGSLKKRLADIILEATLLDREKGLVEFSWDDKNISFATIIDLSGETPLPPYLKRKSETSDKTRYQTIYSKHEGAVAAPTAGLHFTEKVFDELKQKGIETDFVTLHVSAGTFQPIKTENAAEHTMHSEQIVVQKKNIENLLLQRDKFIVPVGTTSMRTLESLYWFGAKLILNPNEEFIIEQTDPYIYTAPAPSKEEALHAVLKKMQEENIEQLTGTSKIYIYPGYDFKICNALVTNFHQPGSTLILLVAAFIGDNWRNIYDEALKKNYRFLSYGDSSLLVPEKKW